MTDKIKTWPERIWLFSTLAVDRNTIVNFDDTPAHEIDWDAIGGEGGNVGYIRADLLYKMLADIDDGAAKSVMDAIKEANDRQALDKL